jgi:hypothetical protein
MDRKHAKNKETETMAPKITPGKIVQGKPNEEDNLRVNLSKREVKFKARLLKYRDRDTRQIIFFIPSLQITSYGADESKAKEMLDFSIDEYFEHITGLKKAELDKELKSLGWRMVPYAKKQFSSEMFVTSEGELENYNAVADEVEHLTLQV